MGKGNVLVIGNSGVGKSTLINAVLGEKKAEVGWGIEGKTKDLKVYECDQVPFRVIDTIGFEPSFFKEQKAISAVKKWSKNSAKEGHEDSQINAIWFCVDGTTRKLFSQTLNNLCKAVHMWQSVPTVVVITKSYSVPERDENIEMVHQAFAAMKKHPINLKKVIPVVADTYVINETAYAAPDGITALIEVTNELMPEGIKAAKQDIANFILERKRVLAQAVAVTATAAGAVVGAIPIPIADALILGPTELAEINGIAKIYGIKNDENSKRLLNSIVEVGTVSAAAKAAVSALKAIPGINLAASVINAIIAGSIVATLGEGSIYIFEQIYLGNKTVNDIDWVQKILESKLSSAIIEKVKGVIDASKDGMDAKEVAKLLVEAFFSQQKSK